jgi:predicted nucleic acid-binding protein
MTKTTTIPDGSSVFIDSNIFVFAALHSDNLGHSSKVFLDRVNNGEIQGFTATCLVSEVIHRFMVKETQDQLGFSSAQAVAYLQKHPEYVRTLQYHLHAASSIGSMRVNILPVTVKDLHASKAARANHGLLANDSLIVGIMDSHNLSYLATNDSGFLRVPSLKVWMPR